MGGRSIVFPSLLCASLSVAGWVAACGDTADTGVSCLRLTCPAGFEADQAACTCKPTSASVPTDGGGGGLVDSAAPFDSAPAQKCAKPCTGGQACNPSSGVCETSPGGGAIRTDLVNKEMSIGLHNNGDGPPQGIREAHLDFNWQTSGTNPIVAVAVPPGSITIDGTTTGEAEWRGVPVQKLSGMSRSSILLPIGRRTNGTAQNMTTEDYGVTEIDVAAAYDGSNIYFRLEWSDDSQNDTRGTWAYRGGKWVRDTTATQPLPAGNLNATRAVNGSDDKVQLLFNVNIPSFFGDNGGLGSGCASLCHLEGKEGSRISNATATDAGTFYSGSGLMHTNAAGQKVDIWNWKASRTNPLRIFDDQVIDDGSRHGDGNQGDDFSYTGGACSRKGSDGTRYPATDSSGAQIVFANEYFNDAPDSGCPSLGPSRAPQPYRSGVKAMFEDGSPFIGVGGATGTQLVPVTANENDTMPGFIHRTRASTSGCLRCQNEAEGRWASGKWVVEMRRSLVAPDSDDVDFTVKQQ